ncbi:MAG: TonB-dependent receptor [Flavobacteriales bacterium]|nr:TonB-dependent receptor [Flavobacteriales bacterium]
MTRSSFPILLFFFIISFCSTRTFAQQAEPLANSQTVRGTVLDADSRQPVIGAAVAVVGSTPPLGAVTDLDGRFTIVNVPVGRIDLRVRAIGFEDGMLNNILVSAGKESVLNIMLTGSITQMDAVTVTAKKERGEVRNDMATVSARTISVEETSRIAGSINDPARMVSAFPGVAGDATGDNAIVARGNSPTGVLWRLEGIEIPNPNHFSEEGNTGGPINVLNSDMLDNSEFYTGAFAPEYGNALSAVFDMHLRDGNDTKREYTLKAGVLGTDLTAEGPMPGVKGGSYLANYRYSTLSLLDKAGIVDYGGVPNYMDASFKLKLPTGHAGTFTLFGLGGISHIIQEDEGVTGDTLFNHADFGARMGVVGLEHTRTLSENSYVHSSISLSGNSSSTVYDEAPVPGEDLLVLRNQDDLNRWTTRIASTLNVKLDAKNKLRSGIILSFDRFGLSSNTWDDAEQRMKTDVDQRGDAATVQAFTSWKWRWNERWSMTSGVHVLHFGVDDATSVEPRMGIRFQQRRDQAFTFGAGLHSRTETLMTYFAEDENAENGTVQPNTGLGLTKAAHLVLGYERMLTEDIRFTVEGYYQHLYDVPVENDPHSAFSLLNKNDWFTNRALVNAGLGRNFGIEASLEKYFTHGWHFMATASLSDARYKALDGVWRNSRFNMGTVANVLAGKEWNLGGEGKDHVMTTGFRYSLMGGQYATPIDLQASIAAGEEVKSNDPWSKKEPAIHKLDVVLAYSIGRPKASHEFKIDVQNVLNSKTTVYEDYDDRKKAIEPVPQLALLPVIQYTLHF